MTKFSEDILGKIKCEHICPVPRWHFLLKSYVFWFLLAVSVLLGSLSFSVIMHLVTFGDMDMLGHLKGNPITSVVMMLPYFWVLTLVLFALVAYYNWKHTKLGYRFKRRWIFLAGVGASVFLGSGLYAFGMGRKIDIMMAKAMPFYKYSKSSARRELWLQPENGLLFGRVIGVDEVQNVVIIQDDRGNDWSVVQREVRLPKQDVIIRKGKTVKIIGRKEGEREFSAVEIRRCGDCWDDGE